MQNTNEINSYNFQSVIALNDHLISKESLEDVFEYIASYLEKDFGIDKFIVYIKENKLFKSFNEQRNLSEKSFFVDLNDSERLKFSIFYEEKDFENIESCFKLIKYTFKLVSQTIFNKYLEFKLKQASLKDSLTGSYNRQYVDEYLKTILPLSNREHKKLAFLKVGIDHFKAVIDEFDYNIGDKVLKELAKSLESSVRESDIVARIDSDEFLVILHNISNENNAIIVADKIINNFNKIKVIVNEDTKQSLMKTVCTGISIYPDDAEKIEEIFRSSDIALYEAKNIGRGQLFKYKKDDDTVELF